jgi:TRAP-type C4-dicarboxylate transport system permease small subunit
MNKFIDRWNRVEGSLIGLLAFLAIAVAFYGIIARYFLRSPFDWGEEVIIYLIIWSVFISASLLAGERGHVAATLLVERFPFKMRRVLGILNALLALAFCMGIALLGFKIVGDAFLKDERSLTALRFPVWIPYLSVVIGCFLTAIRFGLRVYRLLFFFEPSDILEVHERILEEKNS